MVYRSNERDVMSSIEILVLIYIILSQCIIWNRWFEINKKDKQIRELENDKFHQAVMLNIQEGDIKSFAAAYRKYFQKHKKATERIREFAELYRQAAGVNSMLIEENFKLRGDKDEICH